MATTRKAATDPLLDELPPHPDPRPDSANDIKFTVEISPYVVGGTVFYRWGIVDHTHRNHIPDYIGQGNGGHPTKAHAEKDAATFVERIRHTVNLKLTAPDAYTITL